MKLTSTCISLALPAILHQSVFECATFKLIIVSEQTMKPVYGLERFQEKLSRAGNAEVTCMRYASGERRDIIGEIKSLHPDLLITVDLAGFEQCTLTDNISYNLLDCKQLHLLLHENLPNEPYLAGQLSIAMFFYCAGDAYYDALLRRYPNLPWLKKLPGWQNGADKLTGNHNGEILLTAFQEVLRECTFCNSQ